jgi:hypothetical protein
LLGAEQKRWWKDVMVASQATFKIWGNPVPLLRLGLDGSQVALIMQQLLLSEQAVFQLPRVDKLSDLELAEPMLTGTKPFPLT